MWNILYDGFIQLNFPGNRRGITNIHLVAYSDDLAIVSIESNTILLEEATNPNLKVMVNRSRAVSVNEQNGSYHVITKSGYIRPTFQKINIPIQFKRNIRYLGRKLSSSLGYWYRIESFETKAMKTATALFRFTPNIKDSKESKCDCFKQPVTNTFCQAFNAIKTLYCL